MSRGGGSDDTVLEVHEISVYYGGVMAVDDVSFSVRRGQILGFIGPNGAGKTTVFDAVCGFAPTIRGRVLLGGHDVTEKAPSDRARLGLGRSFQDARLFSSLTVFETLSCAFERHMRGDLVSAMFWLPWVRRTERRVMTRVEEIIDLMGLGAFRDKFISELSTGSRRVVDLACVLAHEPTVLLLDEPSSGMAQKETEAMGPLLLRVKDATGCTMLLVEHDMPLVTSVSDELVAMETGRLVVRGKPKDVTNDARVVEAYLGTDQRVVARSGSLSANGRRGRKPSVRAASAKKAADKAVSRSRKPPPPAKKPVSRSKKAQPAKKPAARAKSSQRRTR